MADSAERPKFGLTRRAFIPIAVGVVGSLVAEATTGFAGLHPQPEQKQSPVPISMREAEQEHFTRSNAMVATYLNDALKQRYGVVYPSSVAFDSLEERVTPTTRTELSRGGHHIMSAVWLYTESTIPPMFAISEYSANRTLIRSRLAVDLGYTEGAYYIPELQYLMTRFARGSAQLLDADFDKALQTTFNLPDGLTENGPFYGSSGSAEKESVGQTPDGKMLTFYVNSSGYLSATVDHV